MSNEEHLKNAFERSDIILQLLDARDPMGFRLHEIEKKVLEKISPDGSPTKKIVLVLNKIDLVPAPVIKKWISHLRREFPCVAFKAASVKTKRNRLTRIQITKTKFLNHYICIGGETLPQLLKKYSTSLNKKKSLLGFLVIRMSERVALSTV